MYFYCLYCSSLSVKLSQKSELGQSKLQLWGYKPNNKQVAKDQQGLNRSRKHNPSWRWLCQEALTWVNQNPSHKPCMQEPCWTTSFWRGGHKQCSHVTRSHSCQRDRKLKYFWLLEVLRSPRWPAVTGQRWSPSDTMRTLYLCKPDLSLFKAGIAFRAGF